jgi:hypothetical protein
LETKIGWVMSEGKDDHWRKWHRKVYADEYNTLDQAADPAMFNVLLSRFHQFTPTYTLLFLDNQIPWSDTDMGANVNRFVQTLRQRLDDAADKSVNLNWTPLHSLCMHHVQFWSFIPDMINRWHLDVNGLTNDWGQSPLHLLCNSYTQTRVHQRCAARTLLEIGADPNLPNKNGETPLQVFTDKIVGSLCPSTRKLTFLGDVTFPQRIVTLEVRQIIVYLILYGSDPAVQLKPGRKINDRFFTLEHIQQVLPCVKSTHVNWIKKMKTACHHILSQYLVAPVVHLVQEFITLRFIDYETAYAPSGFSLAINIHAL